MANVKGPEEWMSGLHLNRVSPMIKKCVRANVNALQSDVRGRAFGLK
jgi:hypothetical protein